MENLLNEIVQEVVSRVKKEVFIEVEASGRHVHLSEEDVEKLFGKGYTLTKLKDLSQPGQYACKERVTIIGPKSTLKNVVVLGPCRKETQVEISLTDGSILGLKPPIKQSGDLENTLGIKIATEKREIELQKGLMVAKRHIHMSIEDAKKFNVVDNEIVEVKVFGKRPLIFDDVVVRVSDKFKTYMHIDYDEANACAFSKGSIAKIIKR
ncbi:MULTISPECIES: ethanolamine utilization phosphate acetyltransferase EutD [unclassified Clostridioides]|uniref:ethanolamine utilization phosphate acetyltransferase EutD n=1 Tax=unclassified Clostridioides TaxID=2635829 RepID=UPI001D11A53C|nr:phosphate propanoyltransferase [Clostridioides sp. ZZV14-6150]MCC0661219.1 phosphate propanoyltransferase [Clostridioides sp. ZZV14-6154]MCC0669040.1 phosphate propanoyltransferase [Clostridioides sp. ZZV14-6153]MCC0719518.1 phosphate propanoyltransferase [Clostridioides sp. ZZV14-6105]MCC0723144.1 phosphate propanoyltransferase [Clostridioides sp. ZZV14-6104]MCC0727243.1 phosphate propanoyltransferase [Clostridioides sp. ZZV14-6045]MCC0730965.1 phosphate propanoyltransferase [Clostridioid